jgi:hypothetical protein
MSRYLVILSQLIKTKPTPSESLGNDVFQTDKCTAADEEDIRRVEGNTGLMRMLEWGVDRVLSLRFCVCVS